MNEKYYIFLDYDGVLYDKKYYNFLISISEIRKGGIINIIKPESMQALNHLINILESTYETVLVITSSIRLIPIAYNDFLINLHLNGISNTITIDKTDNCIIRGKSIQNYLKNKTNYDYVVIDDEISDIIGYIPTEKIIKTNLQDQSLSFKDVNDYLRKNNINSIYEL